MASNFHKILSTLIFLSVILEYPSQTMSQDCPYPCYPPPTGSGNNPPEIPMAPPLSPTPPATNFPPPASTAPPAGFLPFSPPSPYLSGEAPPPPDRIVTWFPYYYRKPPHQDQSSSPPLEGSRRIDVLVIFSVLLVCCFVFH
ncbi:hypothetical protein OROGR_000637 [Orobanche gracilis]